MMAVTLTTETSTHRRIVDKLTPSGLPDLHATWDANFSAEYLLQAAKACTGEFMRIATQDGKGLSIRITDNSGWHHTVMPLSTPASAEDTEDEASEKAAPTAEDPAPETPAAEAPAAESDTETETAATKAA